jgi:hypothetical protein
MNTLYNYARQNLALVNIYIKQPVVTRILRDQRIPMIWFVANCGGILGLCMGFSIVTVFEVFHCLTKSLVGNLSSWFDRICLRPFRRRKAALVLVNGDASRVNMVASVARIPNEVDVSLEADTEMTSRTPQAASLSTMSRTCV